MKSKDTITCTRAFISGAFDVLQKAVTVTVIAGFVAVGVYAGGFNGSGTFVRNYDFTDDEAAGINILSSRMDAEFDDIATALSSVIVADGQRAATGNIPMGSNKLTGLASGTAATDAATVGQAQQNVEGAIAAGGSVDALTATFSPALTALADKQLVRVIAAGANTSTTPSFTPNGLTTRTIVKSGGQALLAGDIFGAEHVLLLQYDLGNTRWELLNPTWPGDTTAFATTFLDDAAASNVRTTLDIQEDVMTSNGDLVTRTAGVTARLAIGAANRFPQSDGSEIAWGQVNLGESDVTGTLPIGNIAVFNGLTTDDVLDNDSDFVPYYDAGGATNDKTTLRRLSSSGYLETGTASASASIAFALDTYPTCAHFRVRLVNVLTATAGAELFVRTATDGTPTFESGASDYEWNYLALALATGVSSGDNADSEMQIAEDLDEASPNGIFGTVDIWSPHTATPGAITFQLSYHNNTGNVTTISGGGRRLTVADVTDIQFIMDSGNITSGSFELECVRN